MKRMVTLAFFVWTLAGCVAVVAAAFVVGPRSPAWLGVLVWAGYGVGVMGLGYRAQESGHE